MFPDFNAAFGAFAPQPGMDPFALGNMMANNPEAMANIFPNVLGPPPGPGQSFQDYLTSKLWPQGNLGPPPPSPPESPISQSLDRTLKGNQLGPGTANSPPPPSPQPGMPSMPPLTVPPRGTTGGNPFTGLSGLLPSMPPSGLWSDLLRPSGPAGGTPTAAAPPPAQPQGPAQTIPATLPSPPALTQAPPPTQGATSDAAAPEGRGQSIEEQVAGGEASRGTRETPLQAAVKASLGSLKDLKAPAAPQYQRIDSPRAPQHTALKTGELLALVQAMAGSAPAQPFRLGQALYGGGRGLY